MKIAIIPARGGSKRIPRKNIRFFCGRPIISWSIEAARSSNLFDEIIVSTDDIEIAKVAEEMGAVCPFLRPTSLADDFTPTIPVVRHAINELAIVGREITHACCIYATAPFVSSSDLVNAYDQLVLNNSNFAVPVTTFPFPIQRAVMLDERGIVSMIDPSKYLTRSQDLTETYHDAGQFYWGTVKAWQENDAIFGANTVGLIIPRHRVQDIDTMEDWRRAELMFGVQQVEDGKGVP